jgi:excisionase family DNA binding protein
MKTHSISDGARTLGVDRKTLYRWIRSKAIPAPKPGIFNGRLARVWTTEEFAAIKAYMNESYWGKGIDRRTGKKAKNNQVN